MKGWKTGGLIWCLCFSFLRLNWRDVVFLGAFCGRGKWNHKLLDGDNKEKSFTNSIFACTYLFTAALVDMEITFGNLYWWRELNMQVRNRQPLSLAVETLQQTNYSRRLCGALNRCSTTQSLSSPGAVRCCLLVASSFSSQSQAWTVNLHQKTHFIYWI